MAYYQIDHASGVRLVGAEMMFQRELDRVGEPSVIVDLLARVVSDKTPARALLLGPRAALLLPEMPGEVPVDVLLRGLPDARSTAGERMLHKTLTMWCGGIDRFSPGRRYDLIVMLDEPWRLLTPDSRPLSHAEIFERVTSWLAPEGVLVAQVSNAFSTESLLSLHIEPPKLSDARYEYSSGETNEAPEVSSEDNEHWWRGSTGFPQHPMYWSEVEAVAGATGLSWEATYAAYPAHDFPAMLVNRDDAAQLQDLAQANATRLQGELPSDQPYLQEPTRLVGEAAEAGQLVALAPSWILVLRSGETDAPPELPAMVVGDLGMDERWRLSRTAVHSGDDYQWFADNQGDSVTSSGLLSRSLAISPQPQVGHNLSQLLREALIGGNFESIRRLVQAYGAWLSSLAPEEAIFATPNNVNATPSGFVVVDDSWAWAGQVESLSAVIYCMRHFALRALRAGIAHPWRPDISPDDMTQSLMAMAGQGVTKDDILAAGQLDAEITALLLDIPSEQREEFIVDSIADGQTAVSAAIGGGMGFRDLAARTARLSIALQTRAEQVMWLETSLRNRTTRLNKAEKLVESIRNSVSFRVGQTITWPVRHPLALARERVVAMIPRDLINKGISALKSRKGNDQS